LPAVPYWPAFTITALKIVSVVDHGSLGILSEAAHSGLDLIAGLITFLSVRVARKPADADHQYGRKVENFCVHRTGLLLLTCVWIISRPSTPKIHTPLDRRSRGRSAGAVSWREMRLFDMPAHIPRGHLHARMPGRTAGDSKNSSLDASEMIHTQVSNSSPVSMNAEKFSTLPCP